MIMKGQKISDRYQIIKSIGEGGMANVYLAYDTILDRNVAVKVLRGDLATDEKFVRRFQREALSASSLNHPNIVEVYDVGEDNGQYYIVMEYIEGKHLKELIKKRGHLTLTEVVDIMLQITDGMSVAHDSYIIHRDIKPQNIMILENGLVKITDFGIAMAMNSTQLTQTNSVMGSVHYLPPEQANGKGATLQSDIYSMGILMYELLTGKLPYRGENAVEIALKHLKEPLPSIREEMPSLPNSIENIIKRATAKNIKNRYNDAREMHEDLLTCLDDSRIKEPIIEYKYSENNYDDTRMVKIVKDISDPKKKKEDDKIATQIKPDDLKKQNKLIIALAAVFTGLVVIITTIIVFVPYLSGGKEIKVPDVTNKSVSDAIDILQDAGFEVSDEQEEVASTEVKEGKVVKTNPAAESKRTKGTTITLFVSVGDAQVDIEDYNGKNYLEVKGALEAKGLTVNVEKKEIDDKDKKDLKDGIIIEQDVKAGEKVSVGTKITLYIPDIVTEYPDFTDGSYSVDEVQSFCDDYSVNLEVEKVQTSEHEAGAIFYQSRPAGSTVAANAKLKIKVAEEKEEETEEACDPEMGGCD